MMTDDDITAISSAALLNSFSNIINQLSLLFALVALLIMGLTQHNIYFGLSVVCALLQSYFAARCVFDAAIFAALAGNPRHYQSFDRFLTMLALQKNTPTTRSIDERVKGAMAMLQRQVMSVLMQITFVAIGLIVG